MESNGLTYLLNLVGQALMEANRQIGDLKQENTQLKKAVGDLTPTG